MRQFVVVTGIFLVVVSCMPEENKTTQTNSSLFTNPAEKLAFLKQYVTAHSRILDAEYDISYHDNSTGLLAAPSDWYITTAIRTCFRIKFGLKPQAC
jgi:ethanolamine utilization microcompartment shell protein EutL